MLWLGFDTDTVLYVMSARDALRRPTDVAREYRTQLVFGHMVSRLATEAPRSLVNMDNLHLRHNHMTICL